MHVLVSLLLFSFAGAQALKEIMSRSGETFNKIQKALLSDKDMGPATQTNCEDLTNLFRQAKSQTPNLDPITNDPIKRKELLAKYQEIMSFTISLSEDLEVIVINQKWAAAVEQIKKLKETRKEAHAIFTPSHDGEP